MINMKKALALVASVAVLAGVSACGNSNSGSSSSDSSKTVNMTVWTPSEDISSGWTAKEEKAFEAAHKDYKIKWTNKAVSEADASKTVKQDPSAAADVYLFANDQLGTLIDAKAIGQLSDSAAAQVKKDNEKSMVQSVTGSDGNLYGVPYTGNTWFMYYNKSKFSAEDIKSLDSMIEKGKVAFPISNSWYMPAFYYAAGGTLFGEDGNDAKAGVNFGGSNGAAATTYLVNLAANKNFVEDDNGAGLAGLKTGAVDAYFSGSWDADNVKKALGDNYAAAALPTAKINGKDAQLKSFAGSKAVAYNPNSKNVKVASQFASFLGSEKAQLDHYTMRQIIPSSKALQSNSKVKADPVAVAQAETIAKTSVLQPTISAMNNFWTPCQNFGKAILSKNVNASNAQQKTDEWMNQYKNSTIK
jgi:arabinogalactan oligomer/maltooligosaccharide transport system substrate-binding protein